MTAQTHLDCFFCQQTVAIPDGAFRAGCPACGAVARWFRCIKCNGATSIWAKKDLKVWTFQCPNCRHRNRARLADSLALAARVPEEASPSGAIAGADSQAGDAPGVAFDPSHSLARSGDILPSAPPPAESRFGAIKKDLWYRFAGPTPSDPAEQQALSMQVYDRVTKWFEVPLILRPAPYAGLGLGGRGLGLGSLSSGDFSCFGDWYADDEGLCFYAPPIVPGYSFTYDLVPQMQAGSPTVRVLGWEGVSAIIIDGQEATATTSTVTGKQRQAFHILGSSINETHSTETPARAGVIIERYSGPDLVLTLELSSPADVRSELAAGVARVRQRTQESSAATIPAAHPSLSVADELTKLAALVGQGLLTEAEFQAQKARLLGG